MGVIFVCLEVLLARTGAFIDLTDESQNEFITRALEQRGDRKRICEIIRTKQHLGKQDMVEHINKCIAATRSLHCCGLGTVGET